MENQLPLISIVVPCYNEEEVIAETHRRLAALADSRPCERFEILYVNDGSRDRTLHLLRDIVQSDGRVRVVSFARNFGHQLAVTAGIDHAIGDAVVLIVAVVLPLAQPRRWQSKLLLVAVVPLYSLASQLNP